MIQNWVGRPVNLRCECGSTSFVSDRESGDVICSNCGMVLYTNNLDPGPEWRAYSDEHRERRKRIGSPLTFLESDLGVSSAFAEPLDLLDYMSKKRKNRRLKQIQLRTSSPLKRRMDRVLREIRKNGEKLSLSKSELETAAKVARKALSKWKKKRWNNTALAAASIYFACRISDNAKRMDEIVKQMGEDRVNKKDALKVYRQLTTFLKLHPPIASEDKTLRAITKKLKLSKDLLFMSNEIIKTSEKARIRVGKNPGSVAAASVYITHRLTGKKVTQKRICEAAKTTEVTLRSRVKDIMKNISITMEV